MALMQYTTKKMRRVLCVVLCAFTLENVCSGCDTLFVHIILVYSAIYEFVHFAFRKVAVVNGVVVH